MDRAKAVATFKEIAKACRGLSLGSITLVEAAIDDPKAVSYKIEIDTTYIYDAIGDLAQVTKKNCLIMSLENNNRAVIFDLRI